MTTLMLGGCLFSGFVSGMSVKPESFAKFSIFHPFRTEVVSVDDLAWISAEKAQNFRIAQTESIKEIADLDVVFTPYEFKNDLKRPSSSAFQKPRYSNFPRLARTYSRASEVIRNSEIDEFQDFKRATEKLQGTFEAVVENPQDAQREISTKESVHIVKSSATHNAETEMKSEPNLAQLGFAPKIILHKSTRVAPVRQRNVATQSMNTQVPSDVETVAKNLNLPEVVSVDVAAGLSAEDKAKLSETLLAASVTKANENFIAQAKTNAAAIDQQILQNQKRMAYANRVNGGVSSMPTKTSPVDTIIESPADPEKRVLPFDQTGKIDYQWSIVAPPVEESLCKTMSTHSFVRPIRNGQSEESIQGCPNKVEWLSKNRENAGWVKVQMSDALPTLTLHPAPNDGSTLLIDENSLAMLSLKTGTHITKGMGVIIGLVPADYKIEFLGRGEEVEYFESNNRSYFVIMNAEPGAGILNLESKLDPSLNSAVFAPVVGDTITYLDLAKPSLQDIEIQVVKSGKQNDPEVSNLTVGLSTQAGIQAITQANGVAVLRNANLVRGFPVYVDVSSRHGESVGYSYRFQLKHMNRQGAFVVNQIEEKSISKWLSQVTQGLSDQSAMVVGYYDHKKLDGFKTDYLVKTEALTSKFGLEPLNYTVLWDGKISTADPLEGDLPRFMAVQVPEGLSQIQLLKDGKEQIVSDLFPISPRVIHVVTE